MQAAHEAKKDPRRRHRIIWKIVRPLARFLMWLRLGYVGRVERIEGPFLLVCNHVTDLDPVLVGCSFPDQLYYVASEHLLRSGWAGRFVNWAQAPIPRQKGGNAAGTVMAMLRTLKQGSSVGVFPEGNRCWDGVTGDFLPSIGKLARTSGAKLVTYRLEGGYFASPRWSGTSLRRGRMVGHVVNVYTPEELKAKKPEEINELIRADLHEDAYARQRKDPVLFRGRRLAEHMERLLFICPKCGMLHSLQSKGDTVRCWKCGFHFRYLPTGFLQGEDLPYDNLRDWNRWQDGEIGRLCSQAEPDRPIFSDSDVRVDRVEFAKGLKTLERGEMKLYSDRLEIPGAVLPLAGLTGVSLMGGQDLYLGTDEENYLVRSSTVRCMRKYLVACTCLTGKTYGV